MTKKITKSEITNGLKKRWDTEEGDDTNLYKEYKWLTIEDARKELGSYIEDDGIYFDFRLESENETEANKKFKEFVQRFNYEVINAEEFLSGAAHVHHMSYEALESKRDKEYRMVSEELYEIISEYEEYFTCVEEY